MSDFDLSEDENNAKNPQDCPSRRDHHNALERKRRDHIKASFRALKDAVPGLHEDKSSRAFVLKRTVEYISSMMTKIDAHRADICQLKAENEQLKTEIKNLESSTCVTVEKICNYELPPQLAPNEMIIEEQSTKMDEFEAPIVSFSNLKRTRPVVNGQMITNADNNVAKSAQNTDSNY